MNNGGHHPALVRAGTALSLTTVPTQAAPDGGLLIAPAFVGVCGTDLQILNGSRPDTSPILGHEGGGLVVQAGRGASLRAGQHVVFNPSAQLPQGRILGHNIPGLFQQYIAVDAQAVEDGLVQPIDPDFPPLYHSLVEPIAGVIYTHELISYSVPDLRSAVVFGAGPIGLITAEYLRCQGVRVLLVHSSQHRLEIAAGLGLAETGSMMVLAEDLPARILAWNEGQPLDAAAICTTMAGAPVALTNAIAVLKSGGCVEMVTNYPAASPTPEGITTQALKAIRHANICGVPERGKHIETEISGRRILFTSHRGTSRNHLDRAIQALKAQGQRYTALITHVLSFKEAESAIPTLAGTRGASINGRECIKAVVDLTSLSRPASHPLHGATHAH